MPNLITAPAPPAITPNVTGEIYDPTANYSVAAGATLYATTLNFLFYSSHFEGTGILNNAGTIWNDFSSESYVLMAGNWDAIDNSGTVVAHSSGSGATAFLITAHLFGGIVNSGSIYALSDTQNATAIEHWSGGAPITNSGTIAAQGANWAWAIYAFNGTEVINFASGSILAEGANARAITLGRGHFQVNGQPPNGIDVLNYGLIEARSTDPSNASVAIYVSHLEHESMVIENHGIIRGDFAIYSNPYAFSPQQHSSDTVHNHSGGLIEGQIFLDLGDDEIVNSGQINGYVDMGEGSDLFDNRLGSHFGNTEMGWGADTYVGGNGFDAVTGNRDDDDLHGGGGNDLLIGGWGEDELVGDAGNDGLYGEGGDDRIVTSGGDHVDAGTGDDRVDLGDYRFAHVKGGDGHDVLALPSDSRILDLAQVVSSGRVSGFEELLLANNGRIVVHAADVAGLSGGSTLRISASGAGTVDLAGSWSASAVQTIGGLAYTAYSSGGAQVLVAQGIVVNLGSDPAGSIGLDAVAAGGAAPLPGVVPGAELSSNATVVDGLLLTSSLEIDAAEQWTSTTGSGISGADPEVSLINYGLMEVTGGVNGAVAVSGSFYNFHNYGIIDVSAVTGTDRLAFNINHIQTYGIASSVANLPGNVAGISFATGGASNFLNAGQITATSVQSIAVGILSFGGLGENRGLISTSSSNFVAVGAYAHNGGLFVNTGTVEATGSFGAYGLGSSTHALTLINSGTIRADATGAGRDGIAIDVYYALGFQRITNSGTIQSDVAIRTLGMVNGGNVWLDNSGQITGRIELNLPFTPGQFIPVRDDVIVNRGSINGTIALGTGRDIYDGTHGTQTGTVLGEDGADLLIGTAGANTLNGGAGDDVLFARGGDRLTGGSGSDLFVFSAVTPGAPPEIITDFVSGSDRIDLRAIAPSSVSISGSTISAVTASGTLTIQVTGSVLMSDITTGATTAVTGTSGDDVLVAGPAGATLSGGDGRDLLVGGAGNDRLDGGATPPLSTAEYGDIMWGGAGNDTYVVDAEHDLVVEDLAGGYDTIEITTGIYNFIYQMPAHVERVVGGSAYGNSLDNVMIGSNGVDLLDGGDGADRITGGGGADNLAGRAGADIFIYGALSDSPGTGDLLQDFEHGIDTVDVSALAPTDVTFQFGYWSGINTRATLTTSAGTMIIGFGQYVDHSDFGTAFQATSGTAGDDNLVGTARGDWLVGNAGNDWLNGGAGSDTLYGGDGDDGLFGGDASDALMGGSGADRFYLTGFGPSADRIGDFSAEDRIYLDSAVFSGLALGSLSAEAFSAVGAQTSATRIAHNSYTGELWYDADGFGYGTSGSVYIGLLQSGAPVTASSFVIYAGNPSPITDVRNDFNGDGRSDILWRNVDGQMSNWLGQANGGFTPNNANAAAVVPVAWQIVGTGDFNGDGRDDILWRHTDGTISNWLATAAGGYVANDANAAVVVPNDWHVVGTGDFNGDGRDDILWRNTDGTLSNWLGQANGGYVANDANAAAPVPTAWHVAGVGDFNGDGRDDILWRNDDGQLSNWLGTANGGFTPNNANAAAVVPVAWQIVGTGDFNGDGRDDILWRHTDGTLSNWLGTATGGFTPNDANAAVVVPLGWQVVATGDYNGDGRDDILWRHTDGTLSNWLGNANGGFTPNDANAAAPVPTSWEVQPETFIL